MNLKQAFQAALDFEQKGHKIYKETAANTKNPIVAKTFSYLASQELMHIRNIREYMGNTGKEVNSLKEAEPGDSEKFFSTTIRKFKEKTELSKDDLKAHETALQLEKDSYDFYEHQYNKIKDNKNPETQGNKENKESKGFLSWLMKQENAHYELIQKAYSFIKNPVAFYTEEEKWIADGG